MTQPLTPSKLSILLTAERLYGDFGIDAVSLRRISEEAGQKNKYAAQYHFGDKAGLISAIFRYRRLVLDAYRSQLIAASGRDLASIDIETATIIILRPLIEQRGAHGCRTYVRFCQSVMREDITNALWRQDSSAPITRQIHNMVRKQLPHLSDELWNLRLQATGRIGISMIADYDRVEGVKSFRPERFLGEVVALICATLRAPVGIEIDKPFTSLDESFFAK